MNNPVLELVKWISSHEEDVQTDIAFLMSGFNPVFDTSIAFGESSDMLKVFYKRIHDFSGSDIENIGFIISFKAIFDFIFAKKRGTFEGWEETKELFERVLADEGCSDSMKKTASNSLAELPARREKWIAICNSWSEIKETVLSDESIDKWEKLNFLERTGTNRVDITQ